MFRRFTTAERLFSHGQLLASRRQYPEAVETFRQALALRPRAGGVALHLALALAETAQVSTAIATLQEAMTWQPDNPVLPLFLGQLYCDAADYAQAQHWCDRSLAMAPDNTHALALLALVDIASGRIAAGYERLQQPPPLPMTRAERLALRCSRSTVPSLVQLANTALQSRLLLWVEFYLLQQDTLAQTLSHQLAALSSAMPDATVLRLLDRLCTRGVMGVRRFATRVRYIGQPMARAGGLYRIDAAEAYYLGDVATAQRRYMQLVEQLPANQMARQRLYEVCYEQGDFAAAWGHLQALLHDVPEPAAWESGLMGELLYLIGNYAAATTALQQAVKQGLHDYKVFYYLGGCQLRQGARQQARHCFAQAVQILNPGITALRLDEMYRVYTHTAPHHLPAQH